MLQSLDARPETTPLTGKRARPCPRSPQSSKPDIPSADCPLSAASTTTATGDAPKLSDLTSPEPSHHADHVPSSALPLLCEQVIPDSSIPLIAIEAIIGAGKSTLLDAIKERFGDSIIVVHEPVDLWTNVDGFNLLGEYYNDQKRWGFSFQNFAMMSRVAAVKDALSAASACSGTKPRPRCVVMERSWFSDRECFAALLRDSGAMSPLEDAMHKKMFEWGLVGGGWPEVDGFVYLEVDVEVAQSRVAKRGRCEESCIPSDYQRKLHDKHQTWIRAVESEKLQTRGAPALVDKGEVASPTCVASDIGEHPPTAKRMHLKEPPNPSPSSSSSSSSGTQRVLRLDCSVENTAHVLAGWLDAIDSFIGGVSKATLSV